MSTASDLMALLEHKVEIDINKEFLYYNVIGIRGTSVGVVCFSGEAVVANFFILNCGAISQASWYRVSKTDIKAIAELLNDLGNA